MKTKIDKKRFSVFITEKTYNKSHKFVKDTDLIMERLTLASVMEMALNLFFKEVESKNLETVAMEYLADYNQNPVGVESE